MTETKESEILDYDGILRWITSGLIRSDFTITETPDAFGATLETSKYRLAFRTKPHTKETACESTQLLLLAKPGYVIPPGTTFKQGFWAFNLYHKLGYPMLNAKGAV